MAAQAAHQSIRPADQNSAMPMAAILRPGLFHGEAMALDSSLHRSSLRVLRRKRRCMIGNELFYLLGLLARALLQSAAHKYKCPNDKSDRLDERDSVIAN